MLEFFSNIHWAILFQIILIDISLGGDNALDIALACRNLDEKKRRAGIFWGTLAAIKLRRILIFFVFALHATPFLKHISSAFFICICITLLFYSDWDDSHFK